MKISTALIIEDEVPASARLKRLLEEKDIVVVGQEQSIKKGIHWLQNNSHPDFVFSDIKLSDGLSFEIFERISVNSKIIFTTAYDEFALKAFEYKGLAYLLKPIETDKLENVLSNISFYSSIFNDEIPPISNFQEEFLVSFGSKLKKIKSTEIISFFSENNTTFIQSNENRNYPISMSLDKLETSINSAIFFRINRSVIINKKYIELVKNSEIVIKEHLILKENSISRSRVTAFKNWF
jgi:two-component system response regulator LytT